MAVRNASGARVGFAVLSVGLLVGSALMMSPALAYAATGVAVTGLVVS